MPDEFFSLFCHQLPARSPSIDGCMFPVCFRCAGLHLGMFLGCAYLLLKGRWQRRLPSLGIALLLACLTIPVWIDGISNVVGVWDSHAVIRYLTGLLCGLSMPLLFVPVLHIENDLFESPGKGFWGYFGELAGLTFLGMLFLVPLESRWGLSLWPAISGLVAVGLACFATVAFACCRGVVNTVFAMSTSANPDLVKPMPPSES